jgi:2-polyprenyl-3-methyl-5-hydroxy-6-metoxy-1,4-benzoquinol methylase
VPAQQRDRFKLMFTARPERGLDILLTRVWPEILRREPRAKLYLSRYSDPATLPLYTELAQIAKQYGDSVIDLGNLGKEQLYTHYKQARLQLYPSVFEEISPLRGDSIVDMPSGRETIENLWKENRRNFWVWSWDVNEKRMVLAKANRVVRTRLNTKMLTIRMKPTAGCKARCETTLTLTPDHEVMLRSGEYVRADALKPGDRLMPFGRTPGFGQFKHRKDGLTKRYWYVSRSNLSDRVPEHRYVAEMMLGRKLSMREIVDHLDGDPSNNDPSNLQVWAAHSLHIRNYWERLDAEERAKRITEKTALLHNMHADKSAEEEHVFRSTAAKRGWNNRRLQQEENHVVVSIEHADDADAYCMEVDDTHNFVANGIVVHNCITSMEVAACNDVMVGPWKAALPETCAGCHVLIKDDGSIGQEGDPVDPGFKPVTDAFIKAFVEQTVDLMHNDSRYEQLQKAGRQRAEKWQWGPVAEEWTELFHEIIFAKSSEPRRVIKHFLFRSDVVAAQKYAEQLGDSVLQRAVDRHVDRFMPFLKLSGAAQQRALAQFYEERSGGADADYRTAFWADTEPRLKVLLEFLSQRKNEINSVLDFGCAHGGYARTISNTISPTLRVTGVDVSPSLIRCAEELRQAQLPDGTPAFLYPDNVDFVCGGDEVALPEQYDCVVCMETLEHLPDIEGAIAKLEKHCKPNGWMVFTVPIGNRERDEFVIKQVPPVHVHAFDQHDLLDLFGHRQDFQLQAFSDLKELELDRTFAGWYMAAYRKDDKPVGKIDYERKFLLQGPRETVAVCMITNNNEDVIHRCLRSVNRIADQIVILDNGPSSDRTVNVVAEYTEDIYAGTSPFWCYAHVTEHDPMSIQPGVCEMAGFETPRNESVEPAWTDWILWIDSDEDLLEWRCLWKYLRANHLLGYAVPQHHIAVDPPGVLKKDIPVRLFRNRVGISCYGKVHEHFELGINRGVGAGCMLLNDVHIHHDGYLTETIRRKRFWRNLKLLECDRLKYPERVLGIFLYDMRDNMHLAKYAMESNGRRVTPEVRALLEKVVAAYRKNFLTGDYAFLAEDATNYYSEALAYLGQGTEVCVSLDVKPTNAQLNGTTRFRAVDKEEAKLVIEKLLQAKFAPYEGAYRA